MVAQVTWANNNSAILSPVGPAWVLRSLVFNGADQPPKRGSPKDPIQHSNIATAILAGPTCRPVNAPREGDWAPRFGTSAADRVPPAEAIRGGFEPALKVCPLCRFRSPLVAADGPDATCRALSNRARFLPNDPRNCLADNRASAVFQKSSRKNGP
uniref:Uncharacterized protein n=1 Tax=Trichuris muris TaxID=70415 RepID=A0A5S6Q8V7_TRIMR